MKNPITNKLVDALADMICIVFVGFAVYLFAWGIFKGWPLTGVVFGVPLGVLVIIWAFFRSLRRRA